MPRDKTATHRKLVPVVRQEFLTFGYEKASVNRIAQQAGMSAAGLYRHYKGKEDMFASLVEETAAGFREMCDRWESDTCREDGGADPFGTDWTRCLLDYIYGHFTEFTLLLCCSAGSKYGSFEEELIHREEESSKRYVESLRCAGKTVPDVKQEQWHLAASMYVRAVTEIIRNNMTREEAEEHIRFIQELMYPGMKKLYGMEDD